MPPDAKKLIESICRDLESAQGTPIARDYQNALNLIAQVVFTRTSGFILEFIQNAEDAGVGLGQNGHFSVFLDNQRLKIVHNARPFSETDVRAVCGIQSSKSPERGTLGYLGIGFKSVFKVTSCPQILSGGFQFKFDRSHWPDPNNALWMVLPIWVEDALEVPDTGMTTFHVPLRDAAVYDHVARDIRKLGTELYLFLRWLRRIDIYDEETNEHWYLENQGEDTEGVTTLSRDGESQRFKFFRRIVSVPDMVQVDELTQQYRGRVKQREIAIAFALDAQNDLSPSEAGAMYGGVYSFLPLGETSSGAKFPIQADFLVQPGRDAINCEAAWNHWLVTEVEKLCEEAIDVFKADEKWRFQFLPIFNSDWSASEAQQQLFGPRLFDPLLDHLQNTACIPTIDGGWAKPGDAIRLDEAPQAIGALHDLGLMSECEIGRAFSGEDVCVAHPDVREGGTRIRHLNRLDLLRNATHLGAKAADEDAPNWFRKLYVWLNGHPIYEKQVQGRRTYSAPRRYHDFEIVLTADKKLTQGGTVILIDLPAADPVLADLAQELAKTKLVLHPQLLAQAQSDEERNELKGFLTGYTGVQRVDAKKVCEEVLLPKILITAPRPTGEDLLRYSRDCRRILESALPDGLELWVLTKQNNIRSAKEVLLPTEFQPSPNWEPNQKYLAGLHFLSSRYLDSHDSTELLGWRAFFRRGGVKESPDNGVEDFAVGYVSEYLKTTCSHVQLVEKRNVGYDVEARSNCGEIMRIEVKGQAIEASVELTGNETQAADKYKDSFFLFVVSGIPENPKMYRIQNPVALGVKDKLTIPTSIWKTGRVNF